MEKKTYIAPKLETTEVPVSSIIATSNMHTSNSDADPNEDMLSKGRTGLGDYTDFMDEDF